MTPEGGLTLMALCFVCALLAGFAGAYFLAVVLAIATVVLFLLLVYYLWNPEQ